MQTNLEMFELVVEITFRLPELFYSNALSELFHDTKTEEMI